MDKKTGEEVLVKDDPRIVDPALKESAFLTNIFNRLARSCFYGAANVCDAHLPQVAPHAEVIEACRQATLEFERLAHGLTPTAPWPWPRSLPPGEQALGRRLQGRKGRRRRLRAGTGRRLCALRTVTLLMHPAVPSGCEKICEHMGFGAEEFFNWEHAFDGSPRRAGPTLGPDAGRARHRGAAAAL